MTFVIDSFPCAEDRYFRDYSVVAIDVIRASTTVVTAAIAGRRCWPVTSVDEAFQRRGAYAHCLLAGEVAGLKPEGFDLNNSPAKLALRRDHHRPMVLLSSSGTKLMVESSMRTETYVACLRNYKATAAHIARWHERIALLGAATRGEFREEDQLCCAWIGAELCRLGHKPEDQRTQRLVDRWGAAPVEACAKGNSAAYLRRSGQLEDLHFVLSHINDVPQVFLLISGEVQAVGASSTLISGAEPSAAESQIAA